jgi:hypothetical protein
VPSQDGVAVVRESGVELRAEVQPGTHSVPNTFTPIKITLKNLAPSSVRVALEDIELELVQEGKTSEAVPPQRIKPRPPVGLGLDPASPFAAQAATSSAAVGTPGSAPVAPPAGGAVADPNLTYSADGSQGTDVSHDPVRRTIVATAFTGGEIASGETQEGLVYFATPPKDVQLLRLRITVHSADGRAPVEVIEIPYAVQS